MKLSREKRYDVIECPALDLEGNVDTNYIIIEGDRVVKKNFSGGKYLYDYMQTLIPHLMAHLISWVVPVFSFTPLPWDEKHPYGYQYEMKRLFPLTAEEGEMVHVFSGMDDMAEDDGFERRFSPQEQKEMRQRLETDYPLLLTMLKKLWPNGYTDIHEGNVMKDEEGNYLVVDLESFYGFDDKGRPKLPNN